MYKYLIYYIHEFMYHSINKKRNLLPIYLDLLKKQNLINLKKQFWLDLKTFQNMKIFQGNNSIETNAQQFLKFFRNNIQNQSHEKQKQKKIIDQSQQEAKVQLHAIDSQSELQAAQMFQNIDPSSPVTKKKTEPQIEKTKKIKKFEKQLNQIKQKRQKKIQQSQSQNQKQQQQLKQTKSILLKGRRMAEEQSYDPQSQSQKKWPEKQKQKQIKTRRVTFSQLQPLTQIEKKWKDPIQNQKKGKFDSQENMVLAEAVGRFLIEKKISYEQFQSQLNAYEKQEKFSRKSKIFALISTALPNRSPQSCYKYLKRNFNEMNRKGKWSEDEIIKLKQLVQKHGRKWTIISKELKRTPDNCYDKFRELGDQNLQERIKGAWKFRQLVQLLKQVQKMTKIMFLQTKVQGELIRAEAHDEQEIKEVSAKKYNSKNFIFHNISTLKPYINIKNFHKIDISTIKWNQIALKLKTRNILDCRNKIVQLLQIFFHSTQTQLEEEIIDFLIVHRYQNDSQINWKQWKNKDSTAEQAKNRFMILKKMVQGRSLKPFKAILHELKQKISQKKSISNSKQSKSR